MNNPNIPWGWYYISFDFGQQQAVGMNRFTTHHAARYIGNKRTLKMDIRARWTLEKWFRTVHPGKRFRIWRKKNQKPKARWANMLSASKWSGNRRSRLRRR